MSAAIELSRPDATYAAGGLFFATISLDARAGFTSREATWSLAWFTEGDGDTDVGVVHEAPLDVPALVAGRVLPLEATLPAGPPSYDGKLLKIRWVVQARIARPLGPAIEVEVPFLLVASRTAAEPRRSGR